MANEKPILKPRNSKGQFTKASGVEQTGLAAAAKEQEKQRSGRKG
jgi:hypothetical protein